MKDKRRSLHSRKVFLNRNGFHSDANILTRIDTCEREQSSFIDASVTIKDCNYKVSLSIDLYSKKDYNNTIYKLNRLINELVLFKKGCERAKEWYKEAEERIKERIKAAKDDKCKKSDSGGDMSARAAIPRGILRTPRTRN